MKTTPWLKTITIDDMPNDDLKFVAEEAGLKQALLLIFLLPGITINIPKNGLRRLKEKYIMKNYDGTKSKLNKLALECDLSPRYVYKLIKKNMKNSSSIQSMICDS